MNVAENVPRVASVLFPSRDGYLEEAQLFAALIRVKGPPQYPEGRRRDREQDRPMTSA